VPLQVGVGLQGFILWVPVEKLFMTQIGFTPQSVALMAAAYAAVVPLLEVPSGILADRWSRNWIMVCASAALLASSLLGGLSRNVPTYIAAAMVVGVYFALNSGTVDSMVYDVVLEETGSSEGYETWIGRIRMVESGAFVASALVGGVLAGWSSVRLTYFATLPFIAIAIAAFLRFDEPRLHRAAEPVALRSHIALMYRTMIREPGVRQVMLLAALVGLLTQAVFGFGPLWLVALAAPAALFGPYWAALVSTLGIGGYLTSKLDLDRRVTASLLALAAPAAAFVLTQTRSLAAVIAAQTVLALLLAIISIHAGKLLHDGVASNVRAGVSSGLHAVLDTVSAVLAGVRVVRPPVQRATDRQVPDLRGPAHRLTLIASAFRRRVKAVPARDLAAPSDELACQDLVELVTDYLDGVLPPDLTHIPPAPRRLRRLHRVRPPFRPHHPRPATSRPAAHAPTSGLRTRSMRTHD
jgi:MFS family permease